MEYKETQNSILFKNEYEEEFLKLTKEFGVDAVSKAYSNDEFSIYFFSCIEDQDKINSLMNSLKKKAKCDIIENFDLDNNELTTRTKTNSGYRKTTKSLKDLIQKRISKEEFSKINDKLDYELLNKNSIQEKIKILSHNLKENNVKYYIDNKTVNLGIGFSNLKRLWLSIDIDDPHDSMTHIIKNLQNRIHDEIQSLNINEWAKERYKKMKMIIGGAYQGKTEYARKQYPQLRWSDGGSVTEEELMNAQGVTGFQQYIRSELENGKDVSDLAEKIICKNPDIVLVSQEVGYGVVPVDAFDRKYREAVGRVCTKLAAYSHKVTRVVCGIGTVIKDD